MVPYVMRYFLSQLRVLCKCFTMNTDVRASMHEVRPLLFGLYKNTLLQLQQLMASEMKRRCTKTLILHSFIKFPSNGAESTKDKRKSIFQIEYNIQVLFDVLNFQEKLTATQKNAHYVYRYRSVQFTYCSGKYTALLFKKFATLGLLPCIIQKKYLTIPLLIWFESRYQSSHYCQLSYCISNVQ